MKRKLFLLALLSFGVLFLISCSKAEKAEPVPVEQPQVSQAEVNAQKADQDAKKKAEEARVAEEETQKQEQVIRSARIAFGLEKDDSNKDPNWIQEVTEAKGTGPFVEACEGRFQAINMSRYINPSENNSIYWEKIGIDKKAAEKIFKQTGLKTARLFLKIVTLPIDVRYKAGACGEGEATLDYHEGDRLILEVLDILQDIKSTPKDLNTTSVALRQLALKDFKAQITYWRNQIATQQAPRGGDLNGFLFSAVRNATEWQFTPDELGLNAEEREGLKKK